MPAAVVKATGTATVAAPVTASATPCTGRPGGSKVTAPVMTASAAAAAPARSAFSTVPAAKATATAAMGTPTVAAVQNEIDEGCALIDVQPEKHRDCDTDDADGRG
ncbi:hypothetical protein [Rhodococcus jostii]|uniref:hypothetical protein n=1 Tax=Rhodococcus jostii TaxID=132919 RepID=UPI003636FD20